MGTYHFRRLFGKQEAFSQQGRTSSTRVSRPRGSARTVRLSYAITVPLGSPTAADRLADPRPRAPPDAGEGARARRKRGATGVSDGELRAGVVGDPKAAWVAICGARVVHSRSLARSTCGAGGCVDVRLFFTSRPPATERQLLRRASRSQSQSRRRCPSLLLLMCCRPSRWTTKTNQIR